MGILSSYNQVATVSCDVYILCLPGSVEMGRISKKDEERRRRLAKESSESLSISRDTIEDHIFEL